MQLTLLILPQQTNSESLFNIVFYQRGVVLQSKETEFDGFLRLLFSRLALFYGYHSSLPFILLIPQIFIAQSYEIILLQADVIRKLWCKECCPLGKRH